MESFGSSVMIALTAVFDGKYFSGSISMHLENARAVIIYTMGKFTTYVKQIRCHMAIARIFAKGLYLKCIIRAKGYTQQDLSNCMDGQATEP
jgi:hypothetical protein